MRNLSSEPDPGAKMYKHRWHPILLLGLSLLFTTSFLACTELTPSSTFLTYTDKTNGFSISYPQEWEIMSEDRLQGPQIVAFWAPAAEHEGKPLFTLSREDQLSEASAQSYFEEARAALEESTGYNYSFVSKDELVINGIPAVKHVLTYDHEGERLKAMQVYLVEGKSVWIMTSVCAPEFFDLWEPTFDVIADSFHLF